ncbi:MAG: methionine--tRNA ligase [Planctomycetota bacterium]
MATLLITCALPYSNSSITVGQLQSIYLPSDIYTRLNRLLGNRVLFLCGTDDHGVPITVAADRENRTPEEIIAQYRERIQKEFRRFKIEFDCFSRTHQKKHFQVAQDFFKQLYQNGHLSLQETLHLFCPQCEMFLPDWLVEGQCPHEFCGYPLANGGGCDQCGRDVQPKELIQPRCAKCHETPITRESLHFYFKLTAFEAPLRNWLQEQTHWDPSIHQYIENWWKTGFRDMAITRDLNWGIPIPKEVDEDGFSEKVMYVWFEALLGYITASQEWAEKQQTPEIWQEYWCSSECHILHFLNKKQVPYHAILWPAVIMAQGENSVWNLPHNIIAHQPLLLKAEKFPSIEESNFEISKLLDHPLFSLDLLRYALASRLSKTKKHTLTFREILEIRQKLASGFGNFVHRTLKFIIKHFSGQIPPLGIVTIAQQSFLEKATRSLERIKTAYQQLEFAQVITEFELLCKDLNLFFELEKPFISIKENRSVAETSLHLAISALQSITIAISPILLESAKQIWTFFGWTSLEEPKSWKTLTPECLFPKSLIRKVIPLFPQEEILNPLKKEEQLLELELRYLVEENLESEEKEALLAESDTKTAQLVVGQVLEEEIPDSGIFRYRVNLGGYEKWFILEQNIEIPSLLNQFVLVSLPSKYHLKQMKESEEKLVFREEDGFPVLLKVQEGLKPGMILK